MASSRDTLSSRPTQPACYGVHPKLAVAGLPASWLWAALAPGAVSIKQQESEVGSWHLQ